MGMIQAYKNYFLILIISFVYSEGSWWPDKCNYSDTIITGSDTSITRYICKENGRKEILKEKNGKYHGKYTAWSSNGEKIEEFSYYNDEIDGEVKGWDTTGYLISHAFYMKGKPVGLHKEFYSKDSPEALINYNDSGQKHGLCEYWREDGTRKDSIVYHNGSIKEIRAYYQNGTPRYWVKNINIYNGKKIEASYYDTTGKICGRIRDGNGTYILFSDDAKERWIETYKNGEEVASRKLKPDEDPDWK